MFSKWILATAVVISPLFAQAERANKPDITAEVAKLEMGDVDKPIFIGNTVELGANSLLYMKLRPTLDPGTLEVAYFYWDGTLNRVTDGLPARFIGHVKVQGSEPLFINRANGYVYLGNRLVGGIFQLPNLDIHVVYFTAPLKLDSRHEKLLIGSWE